MHFFHGIPFVLHAHVYVIILRWCDFVQALLFPLLLLPYHFLCYFTPATPSVTSPLTLPLLFPLFLPSVTSRLPRPLLLPLCHFLRYFPSITPCYFSLPLPVLLTFCHFLCYFPSVTSYYIPLPFPVLLPLCYFLLLPLCHALCHIPCYFPLLSSVTSYYFPCHILCYIPLPFPVTFPCHFLCYFSSDTSLVISLFNFLWYFPPDTSCVTSLSCPVTSPCHLQCFFPVISCYLPLPLPALLLHWHFLSHFPLSFLLVLPPATSCVTSLSFPVTSPCKFLCYFPSITHQYSHVLSQYSVDTSSWKANKPWFKFRFAQDSFLSTKSSTVAPGQAHLQFNGCQWPSLRHRSGR